MQDQLHLKNLIKQLTEAICSLGAPVAGQQLRVNLYEQNSDGTSALLDGTMTTYANTNSSDIDGNDVRKLTAGGENIGFSNRWAIICN